MGGGRLSRGRARAHGPWGEAMGRGSERGNERGGEGGGERDRRTRGWKALMEKTSVSPRKGRERERLSDGAVLALDQTG